MTLTTTGEITMKTGSAALDRFIKQAQDLGLNAEVENNSHDTTQQFVVRITRQPVEVKNALGQINNHESFIIIATRGISEYSTKRWSFNAWGNHLFTGSNKCRFNLIKYHIEGMVR
jgi:hypothetical protein